MRFLSKTRFGRNCILEKKERNHNWLHSSITFLFSLLEVDKTHWQSTSHMRVQILLFFPCSIPYFYYFCCIHRYPGLSDVNRCLIVFCELYFPDNFYLKGKKRKSERRLKNLWFGANSLKIYFIYVVVKSLFRLNLLLKSCKKFFL